MTRLLANQHQGLLLAKKGQHSPTPAVWLFLLNKLNEKKTVPVSFSTLEMSFLGTDEQEELAIIWLVLKTCTAGAA